MAALFIGAFLIVMIVALPAGTPAAALSARDAMAMSAISGNLEPGSSPLIQCYVGLILPLLLAGLIAVGSLAKAKRKK